MLSMIIGEYTPASLETETDWVGRTDGAIKKAEEEASKRLMKQIAKKCPGCKRNIEKRDGCDHMTCMFPRGRDVAVQCLLTVIRFEVSI